MLLNDLVTDMQHLNIIANSFECVRKFHVFCQKQKLHNQIDPSEDVWCRRRVLGFMQLRARNISGDRCMRM